LRFDVRCIFGHAEIRTRHAGEDVAFVGTKSAVDGVSFDKIVTSTYSANFTTNYIEQIVADPSDER